MQADSDTTRSAIRAELEAARDSFHRLLGSLSEADWRRQSLNPGWTNGEIVVHMVFAFALLIPLLPLTRAWGRLPRDSSRPFAWLLNVLTGPFNWINAIGPRAQGRAFAPDSMARIYDRVHYAVLKQLESARREEWQRGMYYPTRWDDNFHEFMTLEDVLRYTLVHFNFHLNQIAR